MRELGRDGSCSCGYPNIQQLKATYALLPGTKLREGRFTLGLIRQQSFQSVAYMGWDEQQMRPVVVTEFMPKNQAVRRNGQTVPKRFPDLYQKACILYAASNQAMPLPLIDSFEENGTAYRVYSLQENETQLDESIDRLLDVPVYFRDGSGKPIMNVCALEIPPMPKRREWRRTQRESLGVTETTANLEEKPAAASTAAPAPANGAREKAPAPKKRRGHGWLVALLSVSAVAIVLVGYMVFRMMEKHDVVIQIETNTVISSAELNGEPLASPTMEDGVATYRLQRQNGSYELTARGENGMSLEPVTIEVKSSDVDCRVVLPDPTATPIPRIEVDESRWIFAGADGGYVLVTRDGMETMIGEPARPLKGCRLALEGEGAEAAAELSFAVSSKGAQVPVAWTEKAEFAFEGSEESYTLLVKDDAQDRWLEIAQVTPGQSCRVSAEALLCWSRYLQHMAPDSALVFVGKENTLGAAELAPEMLMGWASEYPGLYGSFGVRQLRMALDGRMAGDAQVALSGLEWSPDEDVYLAGGTEELPVTITVGGATYREQLVTEEASRGQVWTIGRQQGDLVEAEWKHVESLLRCGEQLLARDGAGLLGMEESARLMQDMERWPGAMPVSLDDMHEVSLVISSLDVNLDRIASVQVDGVDVEGEITGGEYRVAVSATGGTAEVRVTFLNGDQETKAVSLEEGSGKGIILLQDVRKAYLDLADDLQRQVSGIISTKDGQYFLLGDGGTADTCELGGSMMTPPQVRRILENYVLGAKVDEYATLPVSIALDGRIDRSAVEQVSLAGLPLLAEDETSCSLELTPGAYRVEVQLAGENGRTEYAELQVKEGGESCVLLTAQADEAVQRLLWWGVAPDGLSLREPKSELLTDEAVAAEMELRRGGLIAVTLQLPEIGDAQWMLTDDQGRMLPVHAGDTALLTEGCYGLSANVMGKQLQLPEYQLSGDGAPWQVTGTQLAEALCGSFGLNWANCVLVRADSALEWTLWYMDETAVMPEEPGLPGVLAALAQAEGSIRALTIVTEDAAVAQMKLSMLIETVYADGETPVNEKEGLLLPVNAASEGVEVGSGEELICQTNAKAIRLQAEAGDGSVYQTEQIMMPELEAEKRVKLWLERTGDDTESQTPDYNPVITRKTPTPSPEVTPSPTPGPAGPSAPAQTPEGVIDPTPMPSAAPTPTAVPTPTAEPTSVSTSMSPPPDSQASPTDVAKKTQKPNHGGGGGKNRH